ncbi:hypothetical protein A3F27_01995 [Candidatus Kaiserbacteria bacterium RIFCSPHIGHO2_12_FULL_53_13]|uniref:Addiction module toxin RelE n=1 Tax=Candidatus Kaiserbacteria bacterium RIFCSPHIGHO2_12_FULL_53_13 TaxID=1798502 RepID=A0A1F6E9P5_9BACT|nr:MAG: hypothetical protein A3F27_01995 [Candidatus Kaiserbacteria bacterium RIFCSPHIGHO2_12_FULL_53_13]OGG74361.1 MAG: hypothetical protein A3A37_02740 [Candidatus Kaiserbacteria bacterium RIFCSPLOWO2_01_FULL_52_36]
MELHYTQAAFEQLSELPAKTRERIAAKVDFYAAQTDPLEFAQPLSGYAGYRFRVGDFRIIFEIVADKIVIVAITKRDKAYRDL